MDNRPIGIFDSGVGGLSILLEIKKLLPNESFIFLADQAYVPYGEKTKGELVERAGRIIEFLVKNDVKAVVVACNTSTVYAIDEMRKRFSLPIIGTVPVIKTIAKISKSKKTAVFSTPATAESPYLTALIKKFAKGVVVYKIGGTGLEELVEDGKLNDKKVEKILYASLIPLVKNGVDAIALGCTHYPFLREKIQKIVGRNVKIVDSGPAVARRLRQVLENNKTLAKNGENKKEDYYFTTANTSMFKNVSLLLLKEVLKNVSHIDL